MKWRSNNTSLLRVD